MVRGPVVDVVKPVICFRAKIIQGRLKSFEYRVSLTLQEERDTSLYEMQDEAVGLHDPMGPSVESC